MRTVVGITRVVSILVGLLLLEVDILVHLDTNKLNPSASDVLLVKSCLRLLAVFSRGKQYACLSCESAVAHRSNLDCVFTHVAALEKVDDVFTFDRERKSFHLKTGH